MKRLGKLLTVAVLALVPVTALAFSSDTGQTVNLAQGQTKTGTYYAAGRDVTIDADVNGDLVCAGQNVTVNGAIHGDILCAAQTLTINGRVDGSVRLAGQVVNVTGSVGRNGTIAGQTVDISGHISGDLGMLAQTASVNSAVDSDVYGVIQDLTIGSSVGGVAARVDTLQLTSNAHVKGNVNYTSPNSATINQSQVGGSITHSVAAPVHHTRSWGSVIWMIIFLIFGIWVIAFVLALVVPRSVERVTEVMFAKPGLSIGVGVATMILTPIAAVLLLFTVIGIPLAVLLWLLWVLGLAFSYVIAAIGVGLLLLQWTGWNKGSLLWAVAIGVPVAIIIFNIPFIGWLAALVALWWGFGGLAMSSRILARSSR
jgi:cytoskeletal protein CcmA (bactofilin family)